MPHVAFDLAYFLCPWPDCPVRMSAIDFRVEAFNDPDLYARAVGDWLQREDFGLVARCPGCGNYVLYSRKTKRCVDDPATLDHPVLPDGWHLIAWIEEKE